MAEFDLDVLALEQEKASVSLRVFVGGPYIDLDAAAPDPKVAERSLLLRYEIIRYVESLGHRAEIGENKKLQNIYENHLEKLFDASTFEFLHVKEKCDAVIILPSSPGSFCELGYFSASDEICGKMLVIREEKYLKTPGYLHFGPSIQASNYNSIVQDMDYEKIDIAKGVVFGFLSKIVVKKISKKTRLE